MNILSSNINWDSNAFWGLLGALLGALLGFLSSLLIELIIRKHAINKFLERLKSELESIKSGVEKNINIPNKIEFTSPIWNFIGQTSILLDMNKKLYNKIISIHGALRYFIECENNGDYNTVRRKLLLQTIENNLL
jgi:hypothetical protein